MFCYLRQQGSYWLRGTLSIATAWLLLGYLLPPAAFAAADWSQSQANQKIFAPYFQSEGMKWSGGWGAFNSTVSEKLGGSCALDSKGQEALSRLLDGVQDDANRIQAIASFNKPGFKTDADKAKRLQEAIRNRLGLPGPSQKFAGSYRLSANEQSKLRVGLFSGGESFIRSIDSPEQLQNAIATSPSLAYCTKLQSVEGQMHRNFTPDPITLFADPTLFFTKCILFLPAWLFSKLYGTVSGTTMGLLLITPHSERGDTIFDANNINVKNSGYSRGAVPIVPLGKKQNLLPPAFQEKKCTGSSTQLGFSCSRLKDLKQKDRPWISAANGLRATLSAVYGIIVVSVCAMYLFRRNSGAQYDLKTIMPRLFFAILLSTAAPYLIGAVISISNFLLQALLSTISGNISQSLYSAITSTANLSWNSGDSLVGDIGKIFSMSISVVELSFISVAMSWFLFVALAKQVMLIFLIILTPFACISFVFRDSGRGTLLLWARGILGVCLIPLGVALCLVLGIQLADVFAGSSGLTTAGGPGALTRQGNEWMPLLRKVVGLVCLNISLLMSFNVVSRIRRWSTGSRFGVLAQGLKNSGRSMLGIGRKQHPELTSGPDSESEESSGDQGPEGSAPGRGGGSRGGGGLPSGGGSAAAGAGSAVAGAAAGKAAGAAVGSAVSAVATPVVGAAVGKLTQLGVSKMVSGTLNNAWNRGRQMLQQKRDQAAQRTSKMAHVTSKPRDAQAGQSSVSPRGLDLEAGARSAAGINQGPIGVKQEKPAILVGLYTSGTGAKLDAYGAEVGTGQSSQTRSVRFSSAAGSPRAKQLRNFKHLTGKAKAYGRKWSFA